MKTYVVIKGVNEMIETTRELLKIDSVKFRSKLVLSELEWNLRSSYDVGESS